MALVVYLVIAVFLTGDQILRAPTTRVVGSGPDVQIFVWGLRWWPYAIQHGLDPFVSRLTWPPAGVSTLWTTTVPGLALLVAPVTLGLGPVAAWNLLCVLAPATAGWAAFLLCRELDARARPALVGGLLFGFSAFEQSQGIAHLQITACAAVPLTARLFVRLARHRTTGPRAAIGIAMIVAAQALISVEVLTTMMVVGMVVLVVRLVVCRGLQREIVVVARSGFVAVLLSLPVTGLIVIEMVMRAPSGELNPTAGYSLDLLNFVLPTREMLLGGAWARPVTSLFTGNLAEQDGYVGVPLVLLCATYLWTRWDHQRERTVAWSLLTTVLLSTGPQLRIAGRRMLPTPDAAFASAPFLGDALPDRFALYTALFVAILAAWALSEATRHREWYWVLAALALLSLLPRLGTARTTQIAPRPRIATPIRSGATVISLPFWDVHDRGLELQAEVGFSFRLVDRWVQDTPYGLRQFARSRALYGVGGSTRGISLARTLCARHITAAIVWPGAHAATIVRELNGNARTDLPVVIRLPCRQ